MTHVLRTHVKIYMFNGKELLCNCDTIHMVSQANKSKAKWDYRRQSHFTWLLLAHDTTWPCLLLSLMIQECKEKCEDS